MLVQGGRNEVRGGGREGGGKEGRELCMYDMVGCTRGVSVYLNRV